MPQLAIALGILGAAAGCDLFTESAQPADLRLCWREASRPGVTFTPPAVAGSAVIFSEGDGSITAREARTGRALWTTRVDTAGALGFNMRVVGDIVVIPVAGFTVALDVATGRERWRYSAPLDVRENPASPKPGYVGGNRVAVHQSTVLIPAWGASVSAVDAASGVVRWSWKPADSVLQRSGAEGVVVAGDTVYVTAWHYINPLGGSSEAWLLALDRSSGQELWRLAFPSYTGGNVTTGSPVVYRDLVIFSTIGGHEFAVNRFTRQITWRFTPATQQATMAQSELFGDVVYHDGGDKFLYALRAADGTQIWRAALHNQPNVDFVVSDRHVFITDDPRLIVLDRATGRRLALVEEPRAANSRFISSVTLSERRIFVSSATAALCFHEPD